MVTMESRMGSMPQPYTSLPASPTLTNPDMILPDYPDYDRSASPDLDRERRSQEPLLMWKNPHDSSNSDLQQLFSGVHAFPSAPTTPTTPIIYGNGTMLSDIGEVTEAESTPGKPSPSSIRRRGGGAKAVSPSSSRSSSPSPLAQHLRRQYEREEFSATPRASSPTVGIDDAGDSSTGTVHIVGGSGSGVGVKQRARQQQQQQQQQQHQLAQDRMRRDSIDSNSTITTQDQPGLFADFDDAVSVGDSVFQGDDEESVAEYYVDEPFSPRDMRGVVGGPSSSLLAVPSRNGGPGSGHTSDEDDRRHSTASISRRAEEILANAKRRLTTMEDNLSRARSTLHASSPSLPSDGSTPSPKTPVRSATAFADIRPYDATYTSMHARLGSAESTPADTINALDNVLPRSASALGAAGGYRPPRSGVSQSIAQMRDSFGSSYNRGGYTRPAEMPLEPLGEDEDPEDPGSQPQQNRDSAQLESFLSPTFGTFNGQGNKGLTRSVSVTQMRDLKHQMKDLKGKISSLREQARADSMKRRSLQSLRTPSPFTYAQVNQWYADPQPNQESIAEEKDKSGRYSGDGEVSNESADAEVSRDTATPIAQVLASGNMGVAESGTSNSSSTSSNKEIQADDKTTAGARSDADDHMTKLSYPHIRAHHNTESPTMDDTARDTPESDAFVDAYDGDDMRTEDGWEEDDVATPTTKMAEKDLFRKQAQDDDELSVTDYQTGGYESESGESLYHDTVQHQISHEDREDAFDYEHFILHSALGTISQQRLTRGSRSDSFSSEDSVETTRGPVVGSMADALLPNLNRRSSLSSIESFATANEGRLSRAKQELSDDEMEDAAGDEPQLYNGGGEGSRADVVATKTPPNTVAAAVTTTTTTTTTTVPAAATVEKKNAEEPQQPQQASMVHRSSSSAAVSGHRPSVSSFESTGTTRSFPLVDRSRLFGSSASNNSNGSRGRSASAAAGSRGATPSSRTSSDNEELKSISRTILEETASICEQATEPGSRHRRPRSLDSQTSESNLNLRDRFSNSRNGAVSQMGQSQALKVLDKEDQYMVERLVGSLGQCVLGLSEHGRASVESRICRRRIEAARRILEGLDPV